MLRIEFSQTDTDALGYERLHHPHPRVQQKMWALWMKAHGLPHHTICELVTITENTLRSYMEEFLEGGMDRLKTVSFYRPTSALDAHRGTLEAHFRDHPPASAAQAIEDIQRLTGIKRGLTQTREYMHRLGLDFRKVGAVPAKADPHVQEDFKKNSWSRNSRRHNEASAASTS
jgi:transposase